jgi:hypothetical protein
VLGTVLDHTIENGVRRARGKLQGMLDVLEDNSLLTREGGADSISEELFLNLGECHRRAGVQMLSKIEGVGSYREMVRAVIDGLEGCKKQEGEVMQRIASLEDPLARAFIRAFLFERDHILDLLNYLKQNEIDHLDGRELVHHAPAILTALRFSQSDLIRQVIDAEPNGAVARLLTAFLEIKHAGGE